MSTHIINGKKFNEDTSEQLLEFGNQQACSWQDGQLQVFRSRKGTLWGIYKYWPNAFGAQNISKFSGEDSVRGYIRKHGSVEDMETVFGEMEEG